MNAVAKIERKDLAPATPSYLLQLAVEQKADLPTLEKLMDLQDRWEAREARKAFVEALTAFKAEPLSVVKNKTVSYTGTSYKHATLAEVVSVAVTGLSKHGLTHRWNVTQVDGNVAVECVLTHAMGHSESVTMHAPPDDSGKKNRIQQIASTVTYLERYTLLAITGLAAKDEDDDGAGGADEVAQEWIDAVVGAPDMENLKQLGEEVKGARLGAASLKAVRAAWSARAKELQA